MKLSTADLRYLADCAIDAARAAGRMIAESRPSEIRTKPDAHSLASQVLTEVDRRSEDLILHALAPTLKRFELALLTEEREDDGRRLVEDSFWCIDPLDGTLPFVQGNPGYSVSIALVRRDGTPQLGVVHDPVEGTLYHAVRGQGPFLDGRPWPIAWRDHGDALSLFTDHGFTHAPDYDRLVAELSRIAQDLRLGPLRVGPTGGAVMNACRVLARPPACYFKLPKTQPGGGSLWDYAATACLFHEAAAVATDIHGQPLDLNRSDSTTMNHRGVVFATDRELAERIGGLWPVAR